MPLNNKSGYGIHLGASTSYRTPKTDAEIPGSVRFSTRSLTSINRKKYLDTDNILNVDYTWQNGFELAAYYHNFRIQGEYLAKMICPPKTSTDFMSWEAVCFLEVNIDIIKVMASLPNLREEGNGVI